MKSLKITTIAVTVLVLCFSISIQAQSLNSILRKLNDVETRLDKLDTAPQADITNKIETVEVRMNTIETNQKSEIERLAVKLDELSELKADSNVEESIAPLQAQVEQIQEEISEIKNTDTVQEDDEQFNDLVADLGGLVNELRTTIENPTIINPNEAMSLDASQAEPLFALSGFGDFFYNVGQDKNSNTQINIGQVELDLETALNDKIDFVGALVFDPDNEVFGLGDLFVDFHLFGSEGDHYMAASGIENGGIVVGQFDIPFGIDLNVYPSIDRKIVSGPLAVEHTHDFWGDFGVKGYVENQKYNVQVFATNGFGYDEVEMRMAAGGHFALTAFPGFEFGTSYAGFLNENNTSDMTLRGFDFQGEYEAVSVKAEYIEHSMGLVGDKVTNTGYYVQGMYDFGKFYLVERYGTFTPQDGIELNRISSGVGYVVREGLELRVEYQMNNEEKNQTFFQMVLGI
ncbi:hypothetical protein ACFL6P_09475 [Candidatus Latescibacterota bacterium]